MGQRQDIHSGSGRKRAGAIKVTGLEINIWIPLVRCIVPHNPVNLNERFPLYLHYFVKHGEFPLNMQFMGIFFPFQSLLIALLDRSEKVFPIAGGRGVERPIRGVLSLRQCRGRLPGPAFPGYTYGRRWRGRSARGAGGAGIEEQCV